MHHVLDEVEEVWQAQDDAVDDFEPNTVTAEDVRERQNIDQRALNLVSWITGFLSTVYQLSDSVAGLMVQFFRVLMCILGQFCSICGDIGKALPTSLYKFTKSANIQFRRYVVCKKCHCIYLYHECVDSMHF